MIQIDEKSLRKYIRDISEGREEALEEFYEKYGRILLAMILSIVRSRESAEEVLQDVLMAIVKHPPEKKIEHARGWLYQVVIRLSRKRAGEDRMRQTEDVPEEEAGTSEHYVAEIVENSFEQIEALSILSEEEQLYVMLFVFGQMKLPQIARLLQRPYRTVRNRCQYAMKKLKKYYRERGIHP